MTSEKSHKDSKKRKHKKQKKESDKVWSMEELPPSVRRRRRTTLYRHSPKSAMFDKVIIGFAVLIAFVMISTKGCDRSIKGLSKMFGAEQTQGPPDKMELKNDQQ